MPRTVIAKRLRASGLALPFPVSLAVSLAVLCASPAPAQVGFPASASPAAPVPAAPAPARNPVCQPQRIFRNLVRHQSGPVLPRLTHGRPALRNLSHPLCTDLRRLLFPGLLLDRSRQVRRG